jgi:DNA-binding sugar fermentation-stimulating protein
MTSSVSNLHLYSLQKPLVGVTVLRRPSASIKSPYVCDVRYDDGRVALCHTAGLGCCGLVEAGRRIYVCDGNKGSKTACVAHIAECRDDEGVFYNGIHPMVSQSAAHGLLFLISPCATWTSEVVVEPGTRLDYVGLLPNGKKIYVEVKNAMISLETAKPRSERRAVFPEGFRKKAGEPVSPRAVKHADTLMRLLDVPTTEACYLLFTVPRTDCGDGMTINDRDPIYYATVRNAIRAGVRVRAFALDYCLDATVKLNREVPFYIDLSVTK